jgi:hypothetical protein
MSKVGVMSIVNSFPILDNYGREDADNNYVNHKIEQGSYDHESEPQRV